MKNGNVTGFINYEDLATHPPQMDCPWIVSKADLTNTDCLAQITGTLTYTIDRDRRLKAIILFVNIFDEIMAEAEVEEMLWKRNTDSIFRAFIYINPLFFTLFISCNVSNFQKVSGHSIHLL
ncbi:MAG: hypothetical protein JRJ76_02935, partial [Deltaproteobacteria bacterium]|nr:hypothetical protein [Deltaproteobacteria bacterium]